MSLSVKLTLTGILNLTGSAPAPQLMVFICKNHVKNLVTTSDSTVSYMFLIPRGGAGRVRTHGDRYVVSAGPGAAQRVVARRSNQLVRRKGQQYLTIPLVHTSLYDSICE